MGNGQLKAGWQVKELDEVCKVVNGGTPKTRVEEYWGGEHFWVTPAEMGKRETLFISGTKRTLTETGIQNTSAQLIPPLSVILSTRAPIGHLVVNTKPMAFNQGCRGLIPSENLDYKFLYYFLFSNVDLLNALGTGATFKELSATKLKCVNIPLPPLPEQKRIVAILDEAFAGISLAVANTEKNLANTRELFESYLENLSFEKQPLGDFVDIKTGKLNANAAVEGGQYPFFTCSRDVYEIDNYAFELEAILLAGNNASGDFNVKHFSGKFNAYQRTYIITIRNEAQLLYRFLYFQLIKSLKELKQTSVGAGTKFLKLGMIKELMIAIPPVEEQQVILNTLESLLLDTKHLETIYQQKLTALNELKQSILQKAFTGELTQKDEVT